MNRRNLGLFGVITATQIKWILMSICFCEMQMKYTDALEMIKFNSSETLCI